MKQIYQYLPYKPSKSTITTCAAMLVAKTDRVKYCITLSLTALVPGFLANLTAVPNNKSLKFPILQ